MMSSRFVQKVHSARANGHCLHRRNCNPLLLHYHIPQLYFECNHLILFVYVGQEDIRKYIQYEVSVCLHRQDNESKKSTKMAAI